MWRQGDVLIERVDEIPRSAGRLEHVVLASGDTTGHSHRIKDRRTAQMFLMGRGLRAVFFLEVTAEEAKVEHPEHGPIVLPRGMYRVWRQREFGESGARFVAD